MVYQDFLAIFPPPQQAEFKDSIPKTRYQHCHQIQGNTQGSEKCGMDQLYLTLQSFAHMHNPSHSHIFPHHVHTLAIRTAEPPDFKTHGQSTLQKMYHLPLCHPFYHSMIQEMQLQELYLHPTSHKPLLVPILHIYARSHSGGSLRQVIHKPGKL